MLKKKATKAAPADVPEVIEVIDAMGALEDFKREHAEVFEQLQQLAERYNSAIENAEKACRSKEVSCGPYDLYQFTVKYDPGVLYSLVGHEEFLKLGGKVATTTMYDVDKTRFEAAVAQKLVDPAVVAAVRKETANFHQPKPLVIP